MHFSSIYWRMVSLSMQVNNLNKVRQLPREDRSRLFQSLLFLPLIHLALLSLGYYRLRGMMERFSRLNVRSIAATESEFVQQARKVARIVDIAAERGAYKATCLRRSLLLWWFLRREGIPSDIRFGVRKGEGKLEAH